MATYYGVNAGGNWSAGATWSTVSAKDATRVGGAVQPTATDTVVLDDYSGNVTVDTTTCICSTLDMTGYMVSLAFTAGKRLVVIGNCTLAGTTGTGTLCLGDSTNSTCALNVGGVTFSGKIEMSGTGIKTLYSDWIVTGVVQAVGANHVVIQASSGTFTISSAGGFWVSQSPSLVGFTGGNLSIKFRITGGSIGNSGGGAAPIGHPLIIAGNVTIANAWFFYTGGKITYESGTFSGGGGIIIDSACTFECSGVTFGPEFRIYHSGPHTLTQDLNVSGLFYPFTGSGAHMFNTSNASKLNLSGGLNLNMSMGGTATIVLSGGTWSGTGALSSNLRLAGNVTINSVTVGSTATITYTSGTLAGNKNITLTAGANVTFNTANMAWGTIANAGSSTITLAANLVASALTPSTGFSLTVVPAGYSVTLTTLTLTGGSTLLSAASYSLYATAVWVNGNTAGPAVITNSSGTVTLNNAGGSSNHMNYAALTNVASATATLYNWQGTCTACTNILAVTETDIGGGGVSTCIY